MSDSKWSWQQAVLDSDIAPTTKHLLLTLGCYMNAIGDSCYPSIETLCQKTGLSNRTVITHLKIAQKLGFIEVKKHGFGGQSWARNEYKASLLCMKKGSEPNDKGSEIDSPPLKKAVNLTTKGSEPNDKKAVKEVHTNRPLEQTIDQPIKKIHKENLCDDFFDDENPPPVQPKKPKPKNTADVLKTDYPIFSLVDQQVLIDWIEHRKKNKTSNSVTALRGVEKTLNELWNIHGINPSEALSIQIERGWRGIIAEWILNHLSNNYAVNNHAVSANKSRKTQDANFLETLTDRSWAQ